MSRVFSTTVRETAGGLRLTVRGDIDMAVRQQFDLALHDVMRRTTGFVDVDFSGVTFLDCSGIGVLAGALDIAHACGQIVQITGQHGIAAELLNLTGILSTAPDPAPPVLPAGRARTATSAA